VTARKSIFVEGFSHGAQPIPAASRVGNLVMTGGVYGLDRATGQLAGSVQDQARHMFENLERILQASGTSLDRVVKMTFYIKVPDARAAINDQWLKAFPDPASRPARHVLQYEHLAPTMWVQCDAIAVLDDQSH
jgi:2-iminobutanoate/2-iminopropanoate deaminase